MYFFFFFFFTSSLYKYLQIRSEESNKRFSCVDDSYLESFGFFCQTDFASFLWHQTCCVVMTSQMSGHGWVSPLQKALITWPDGPEQRSQTTAFSGFSALPGPDSLRASWKRTKMPQGNLAQCETSAWVKTSKSDGPLVMTAPWNSALLSWVLLL